jgi:uncharacterized membrane protein (UPF0182 family)
MGEWMARVSFYAVAVDPAPLSLEWKGLGVATAPELLEFMRRRLPWPLLIAGAAGLFAMLVAWREAHNWGVFLQFLYRVPYGASDPLYDKDIAFYFFSLPAYVVIKNWMLITLFLSVLCRPTKSSAPPVPGFEPRPPIGRLAFKDDRVRDVCGRCPL